MEMSDPSVMMKPERRRSPRIRPETLAYINIEPENGGIVLDVSEGGLGFHVVGPVKRAGPIRLWFSLEPGDRLEATGEIVWTDETKKVGGLQFTHLAEGLREQIRSWAARSTIPMTSEGGFPASVAPPKESPGPRGGGRGEDVEPASTRPRQRDMASLPTRAPTIVPSQFALTPEPEPAWDQIGATWPDPAARPRFIPGILTGILTLVLLVTAFLLLAYRRDVGDSLIRLGERIAPKTEPQTASPAPRASIPAPNPSPTEAASADKARTGDASSQSELKPTAPGPSIPAPNPSPAEAASADKARTGDASSQSELKPAAPGASIPAPNPSPTEAASADKARTRDTSSQSERNATAPNSTEGSARSSQSVDTGQSELTVAQQYLRGGSRQQNRAAGAQWLWAAVKKGNTTAEVLLADLYRSGDGVRKSCGQARALLIAASRRGNVEAMEKLRELNRNGCR